LRDFKHIVLKKITFVHHQLVYMEARKKTTIGKKLLTKNVQLFFETDYTTL